MLVEHLNNMNQITAIEISFYHEDEDTVLVRFGNLGHYTSNHQDLGSVLVRLRLDFAFSYAKCFIKR